VTEARTSCLLQLAVHDTKIDTKIAEVHSRIAEVYVKIAEINAKIDTKVAELKAEMIRYMIGQTLAIAAIMFTPLRFLKQP